MKKIPTQNVGFEILESKDCTDNDFCSIVLGHHKNDKMYVTWLFNHQDGGFYWGHYFPEQGLIGINNALKDYEKRN